MKKIVSEGFKTKAVKQVLSGRTAAEVARQLGISACTLRRWVKQAPKS